MSSVFSQKDTDCNRMEAGPVRLVLHIQGMGPVPSLKNHKRSIVQPNGTARPITDPDVKKWMKRAVRSLEFQLNCGFRTIDGETQTPAPRRSWTALLPLDDNWRIVRELNIQSELCEPGDEGATITIERL